MPDATHPRSAAGAAHSESVRITVEDLITTLTEKLGTKLVAFMVDKDPSSVGRWRSGRSKPSDEAVRTMRSAYQVFQMLERHDSDATIRAWFMGMNPQLDDASPLEALQDGRNREVMAAARAFATGG
jgi:hypothetical protein